MKFAKLARFYGWTHEEIYNLEWEVSNMYWEAITAIEAQDMLMSMKLQDYPHSSKNSRKKLYKEINDLAYPKALRKSTEKELSLSDFAKLLAGGKSGR